MKLSIQTWSMGALLCLQLLLPAALFAVEIAPRISDREIIEKLTVLEAGQKTLNEKLAVLDAGQKELRAELKFVQETLRSEMKAGQEALRAEMKAGQEALRSEMKAGQEALRSEMKSGQESLRSELRSAVEAINKRQDDTNNTMLALFASLVTLIVALFGYIAWDRRTMVKPLIEQVNSLDRKVHDDLDLDHSDGSLLRRQLQALRAYAEKNPEFAEIMRGVALL